MLAAGPRGVLLLPLLLLPLLLLLPSQPVQLFPVALFTVPSSHCSSRPVLVLVLVLASGKCLHFSGSGNAYCFRPFIHFPFAFFAHLPLLCLRSWPATIPKPCDPSFVSAPAKGSCFLPGGGWAHGERSGWLAGAPSRGSLQIFMLRSCQNAL